MKNIRTKHVVIIVALVVTVAALMHPEIRGWIAFWVDRGQVELLTLPTE